MRMIALGQAWQKLDGKVHFVGNTSLLSNRLREEGFAVSELADIHPSSADFEKLIATTSPTDWIALDGYHFDQKYMEAVRSADRKTIVLDDVNNRKTYNADILLNQNPDGDTYQYRINDDAIRLLGTRYTLLRKDFLEFKRQEQSAPPKARNILITLGGGDSENITTKVIEAVGSLHNDKLHVKVLAGAANPHLPQLHDLIKDLPGTYELLHAVTDMPRLINWADLAVSAAGSTCWELCFFGVPIIAIKVADNQEGVSTELARHETALCLDTTASVRDIADAVRTLCPDENLRRTMSENGQKLIDGKGADRVAAAMYCFDLTLRPARDKDSQMLLEWRNSPTVRSQSFNSLEIDPASHQKWFEKKLASHSSLLLVAEDNENKSVGQIRFDKNGDEAMVSISVAPEMNGRGIGTAMTKLACLELARQWPDSKVVALVKRDNPASASMFEKAGFTIVELQNKDHMRYEWTQYDYDQA